jgi:3-phosphoshikimate 1-carboxyvinyltransferase
LAARRSGALRGRVRVPGDKSISHRALIFGALTVGETPISGLLEGEDVINTANAMRALGATVERTGEGRWRLRGVGVGGFREPAGVLDFGNSVPAAGWSWGRSRAVRHRHLRRRCSLRKRPMQPFSIRSS